MIVNDYKVKWFYDEPETKCLIQGTVIQLKPMEMNSSAIGIARCGLQDQFRKEVGRKISLQRALKQLFPNTGVAYVDCKGNKQQHRTFEDAARREAFWDRYNYRGIKEVTIPVEVRTVEQPMYRWVRQGINVPKQLS